MGWLKCACFLYIFLHCLIYAQCHTGELNGISCISVPLKLYVGYGVSAWRGLAVTLEQIWGPAGWEHGAVLPCRVGFGHSQCPSDGLCPPVCQGSFGCFSLLSSFSVSHAVSEDKIRKLIRLPTIIVAQGINFDVKFRPISRKDCYIYFSGGSVKRSLYVAL